MLERGECNGLRSARHGGSERRGTALYLWCDFDHNYPVAFDYSQALSYDMEKITKSMNLCYVESTVIFSEPMTMRNFFPARISSNQTH